MLLKGPNGIWMPRGHFGPLKRIGDDIKQLSFAGPARLGALGPDRQRGIGPMRNDQLPTAIDCPAVLQPSRRILRVGYRVDEHASVDRFPLEEPSAIHQVD